MYKQVIVVNKSLNMSPGKLGAMVAHGATSFFCEWFKRNVVTSNETYNDYLITPNARVDKELFAQWISGSFTKIVLEVEDDAAMKAIIEKASFSALTEVWGAIPVRNAPEGSVGSPLPWSDLAVLVNWAV